jgi:3-dehydroquinate synthetase
VLARHGLPTRLDREVATRAILEAIGRDKKSDGDALNMVLLAAPGDVRLGMSPARERVVAAVEELRS